MTKPKSLRVLLIVLAFTAQAMSAERQRFIPWSPLNESELANERANMRRTPGLTEASIEKTLKNQYSYHTYRDADIFKAYPELRGHEKLYVCTNRMMSDATAFVFLASREQNEVALETVQCSRLRKGLSCGVVVRERRYFLDGSDRYFSLEGVELAKAAEILDAYKGGRITGLPDWMSTEQSNISLVKALPDEQYLMIFGDYLCGGCVFKINVKTETADGQTRLIVVGSPEGGCI
jgi:hypothetical protein